MGIAKCSCHVRLRGDYMPLLWFVVSVLFICPIESACALRLFQAVHNFHVSHVDKTA